MTIDRPHPNDRRDAKRGRRRAIRSTLCVLIGAFLLLYPDVGGYAAALGVWLPIKGLRQKAQADVPGREVLTT